MKEVKLKPCISVVKCMLRFSKEYHHYFHEVDSNSQVVKVSLLHLHEFEN